MNNEVNNMGEGQNYGKFIVDNSPTMGEGSEQLLGRELGQVKYAKRGGYESQYCDPTRYTENDQKAYDRSMEDVDNDDDSDESQGGMY